MPRARYPSDARSTRRPASDDGLGPPPAGNPAPSRSHRRNSQLLERWFKTREVSPELRSAIALRAEKLGGPLAAILPGRLFTPDDVATILDRSLTMIARHANVAPILHPDVDDGTTILSRIYLALVRRADARRGMPYPGGVPHERRAAAGPSTGAVSGPSSPVFRSAAPAPGSASSAAGSHVPAAAASAQPAQPQHTHNGHFAPPPDLDPVDQMDAFAEVLRAHEPEQPLPG